MPGRINAMSKKRPTSAVLPWTGVILLLCLAAGYFALSVSSKRSLAEAEAAIKADGRPTEMAAILPPELPDAENARIDYQAAAGRLRNETRGDADLFSQLAEAAADLLGDSADPDALEKFRELYESGAVAEALTMIEEGALKEGYRNELDFTEGFNLQLPHLEELMNIAKILAATAQVQAADGDQAGAWDTALTALRLANALEEEPILVSQLVRLATMKTAIDSIRTLDYSAAPAAHLAEIDVLMDRFDNPDPMVAAVDTERLMAEHIFSASWSEIDLVTSADSPHWSEYIGRGAYRVLPSIRSMDRAAHSNALREYASNLAQPFSPDDLDLGRRIMRDMPPYNFIARATTPAIGAIKEHMTTGFAESRVTRAGIAAIQYKEQHGSYPPDLSAIGGIDVTDPFTGEPLIYRPESSGFTIMSVGANLSGETMSGKLVTPDDIRWRYVEASAAGNP